MKNPEKKQPERQEKNQDEFGAVEVRTTHQVGGYKSAKSIQWGKK